MGASTYCGTICFETDGRGTTRVWLQKRSSRGLSCLSGQRRNRNGDIPGSSEPGFDQEMKGEESRVNVHNLHSLSG
jgi:hypothetical protein